MAAGAPASTSRSFKGYTWPVAAAVATVVVAAWVVTWVSTDWTMALMSMPDALLPTDLAVFFAVLVVMMVAMMLPSALPMVITYQGITRLEAGRLTKPADHVATALFASAYFLVWGGFAVVALLGLMAIGILDPMMGAAPLLSTVVLVAAGAYQLTRPKEVCLAHCQSPMGFLMHRWRPGRAGALRMGLHHSFYCIGCCWLFMLVLFVAGAMSLLWMGVISVAIFAEKLGTHPLATRRGIAVLLFALAAVLTVPLLTG